jgi:hypothetical protein
MNNLDKHCLRIAAVNLAISDTSDDDLQVIINSIIAEEQLRFINPNYNGELIDLNHEI